LIEYRDDIDILHLFPRYGYTHPSWRRIVPFFTPDRTRARVGDIRSMYMYAYMRKYTIYTYGVYTAFRILRPHLSLET